MGKSANSIGQVERTLKKQLYNSTGKTGQRKISYTAKKCNSERKGGSEGCIELYKFNLIIETDLIDLRFAIECNGRREAIFHHDQLGRILNIDDV